MSKDYYDIFVMLKLLSSAAYNLYGELPAPVKGVGILMHQLQKEIGMHNGANQCATRK